MNDTINISKEVFSSILSDFSSLWSTKIRGNTLEIITPFSTLLGDFISVFLTKRDDSYIISDGNQISRLLVENELKLNNKASIYIKEIATHYKVKNTNPDQNKFCFYFKTTKDIKLLSAYIYDIIFFENAVLNSIYSSQVFFQDEDTQLKWFSTQVNNTLEQKVQVNREHNRKFIIDKKNETYNSFRFNAVLLKEGTTKVWLAMYISGSTSKYFCDNICRANMGFGFIRGKRELDSSVFISVIIDENSKGNEPNNQSINSSMDQIKSNYKPTIYNYKEFQKIDNLDTLFQESK